ncbi:MAG: FAD-dependent oxidoreductase [Bdellovibrionaceae bacterium]|nr:FAD-dependent oxidoreductase [Pseudobdellovibrionaceae bacterium]
MSFTLKIQTLEKKYKLNLESFNFARRQLNRELLTTEEFDIVVVGGGIVGTAFVNQASHAGLKVALLEASHFGSGTSSRTSKLIHGGLRYLEQWDFKLVFESLKERSWLLKHNGHLVKKLPFVFPIYKGDRIPKWKMSLGFWLYDCLSLFKGGKHTFLNTKAILKKYPHLKAENLQGAFLYTDAQMNDVAVTRANLLSSHKQGAVLSNYSEVIKIETVASAEQTTKTNAEQPTNANAEQSTKTNASKNPSQAVNKIQVYDKLLNQNFSITAKHVLLSLGPWTDIVGKKLFSNWKPFLSLSQGSHVYIKKERLFCEEAIVINSNKDGRIIFVIPSGEYTLVGTTETPFYKDPSLAKTEEEDIQYLLSEVNAFFPNKNLQKKDCVSYFSGVRPLVATTNKSNGVKSREHWIGLVAQHVSMVVGGKFTTHRKMSKDIINHIYKANKSIKKTSQKKLDTLPNLESPKDVISAAADAIEKGMCFYLSDFFQYHTTLDMRQKLTTKVLCKVEALFAHKYFWTSEELEKQKQSLAKYFKDCGIKLH